MSSAEERRDKKDWVRREQLALLDLTDQQRKLCESYIRCMDKAASMIEAGYWVPKKRGAKQLRFIDMNFERYISPPHVQRYLMLLKESVASRLGISMDDIIDEFRSMAFTNMEDYVSWSEEGITITDSASLTRAQKAGVVQITETTTRGVKTIKIKLHNKQPALDRLYEILKELESIDRSAVNKPHAISQTQINMILGDPGLRRAVENLAEHMGSHPVKLVGQDQHRIEFDRQIEQITSRLLDNKEPKRKLTTATYRISDDDPDDDDNDEETAEDGAGMAEAAEGNADTTTDESKGELIENGESGDSRDDDGEEEASPGGRVARRAEDGGARGRGDGGSEAVRVEGEPGPLPAQKGRSNGPKKSGEAAADAGRQGRYDDIDGL